MIVATALVLMMTLPGLALFYSRHGAARRMCSATMAQSLIAHGRRLAAVDRASPISSPSRARAPASATRRACCFRGVGLDTVSPLRQDHPRNPVHGLSDDLRGHHLRAGRRLGRGAHEVLGLHACSACCGCSSSTCRRRIGCGAAASCRRWACSISPAARSCTSTRESPASSARWCWATASGFGRENHLALRSVARRRRHGPALGRLVRLQRRLGAGRRFARGLRHRRDASRRLRGRAGVERAGVDSSAASPPCSASSPAPSRGSARSRRRRAMSCPGMASSSALIAGVVCYWFCTVAKHRFRYDDTLDVFGVHGVGGIMGTLLAGVFATRAITASGSRAPASRACWRATRINSSCRPSACS